MSLPTRLAPTPSDTSGDGPPPGGPLGRLLVERAALHPAAPAFAEPPASALSSGRSAAGLSWAGAVDLVRAVASHLDGLSLAPRDVVAIVLPGGKEAWLAALAAETVGCIPCPIPVFLDPQALATCLEAVDARAVVTQARIGDLRPAETLCSLASRLYRLRSVLAWGPGVPDGAVDLDRPSTPRRRIAPSGPPLPGEPGVVTFDSQGAHLAPFFRSSRSLLAAGAVMAEAMRLGARDHVVSLLAPDDLKGLAAGPVACLVAGASLEMHALPRREIMADPKLSNRTHFVLPGWADSAAAALGLHGRVASVVLVHEAGADIGLHREATRILHVAAYGEHALVPALPAGQDACAPSRRDLIEVRISAVSFQVRGLSTACRPLGTPAISDEELAATWKAVGDARGLARGRA